MATQVAREGFAFTSRDGMPRVFSPGDLCDDQDPDYRGREHLFQPAEEATIMATSRRGSSPTRATETATAAPGEQRARTRPDNVQDPKAAQPPKPGPKPDAK